MPWSSDNVPTAASELKGEQLKTFVAAANSTLKEGYSDEEAIKIGLAAANKINKNLDTTLGNGGIDIVLSGTDAGDKMNIEKTLNRDKERVIQSALREKYKGSDYYPYVFEIDSDKSEVYYEMWLEEGYKVFMLNYSMNADNTSATLSGEPAEVVPQTEYKTVSKSQEEGMFKRFIEYMVEHLGGTQREASPVETPIIKQFDEEQMIAWEPLYIEPDGVDGHGWTASADVLKAMVESCNEAIKDGRLIAKYNHTEVTDDFEWVEAISCPFDCYVGDKFIPEGQPLIKSQFKNKEAWEERKSGKICGPSIGAKGVWEEIND